MFGLIMDGQRIFCLAGSLALDGILESEGSAMVEGENIVQV